MALRELVIRSQLVPPRQQKGVLRRPRLESRLLEVHDYPLTLVHAGTGYGKSTALAALADLVDCLAWYTVTEPDRDPLLFLAHLLCAFERHQPAACDAAFGILEETGGRVSSAALTPLINVLTTGLDREAVLVLDDYHLVADVPEIAGLVERLVDYLPPRLHLVLSSRHVPPLSGLNRWRVKGRVLALTRADLAFTAEEIEALFRDQYGYPIGPERAQRLAVETEGWAIALQMVWQRLQSGTEPNLDAVLGHLPSSLDTLFDYLAQDVLARQPRALQRFLLTTSVLRELEGSACDRLLEMKGSAVTLRRLYEDGLFVVALGDEVYRYHRLFHDFLRTHLRQDAERWWALQCRAAEYFRSTGQLEESVYHFLEAQEYTRAAELLQEIGPGLISLCRFDSFSYWLSRLPPEVQLEHPALDLLLGDVLRLRAQFEEALSRYQAAEARYRAQKDRLGQSRALRGQAQIYLDTIRPLKAESLLEEALRLLEPMVHRNEAAALLDLLAENKLNLGSPDEAEALHHEALLLRTEAGPGDIYLEARAMLRTGRLAEARRLLEMRAEEERQAEQSRPQRFHRETLLLLSLICALQGDAEAAERTAREGIAIGQRLQSAFVVAVGAMRLGNALQLQERCPWHEARANLPAGQGDGSPSQRAKACYERAIEQVRPFNVLRTHVEPLWGLCRIHGYGGDLAAARRCADQALDIGCRAGDEWICDLVRVTMGASYALHGESEQARMWLAQAAASFERVGDRFGLAASWLWLALDAWWAGDSDLALKWTSRLLPLVREGGWDYLLTRRTFLGLQDEQAALPLLVESRRRGIEAEYAGRLLEILGLADVEYHPGHTLWVRTLGTFAVWRGGVAVTDRDWQREKARQVFQLFLSHRGQWFYREQVAEHLWPHLPPEVADRDFRVALNALSRALEPDRPRSAPMFVVSRRGNLYGLNPAARVRVDVDEFERLAASDDADLLRQAMALYEGDYLPECLYADWSAAERQRLRHLYLTAAERLARHLVRLRAWDEASSVCDAILACDNCWEAAYRLLMRIHAAQGNRAQVLSTYQRCAAALRDELEIEPSQATQALLDKLP